MANRYSQRSEEGLANGRPDLAYLFANEALLLMAESSQPASRLLRHALYSIFPQRRFIDKAARLHERAHQLLLEWTQYEIVGRVVDNGHLLEKALELVSRAKRLNPTSPGILETRAEIYGKMSSVLRPDLAYVDITEALALYAPGNEPAVLQGVQFRHLRTLGHNPNAFQVQHHEPLKANTHHAYRVEDWPTGIKLKRLNLTFANDFLEMKRLDGMDVEPPVPIYQLADFINGNVASIEHLWILSPGPPSEGEETQLWEFLSAVGDMARLGIEDFILRGVFYHTCWERIQRIFTDFVRAKVIRLTDLNLPPSIDANRLLELPSLRAHCISLTFKRTHSPMLGITSADHGPRFGNEALLSWLKSKKDNILEVPHVYLTQGVGKFVQAIKKDFLRAKSSHPFVILIGCHEPEGARGIQDGVTLTNPRGESLTTRLLSPEQGAPTGRHYLCVVMKRE